ncbi:hypothetical protein [Janthinobacterium lividum]|uniref:hypothetical protein n=1 Tax=Janthinobacterium lividum TaxID=29581 RepID=UPI0008DB13B3|nr:hypothetical protein [Janthinobacterium lividum]
MRPRKYFWNRRAISSTGKVAHHHELVAPLASLRRLRRKTEQATGLSLPINTARNAGYRFFANAAVRP